MTDQKLDRRKRERPSFVWPIILITIGAVFLLNNLRLVEGDFWSTLWQWWPVLLIAIGLDSLFRRNEIAGPIFLIGLGLVILVSNLGLVGWETWNILIRLWPVLLVAFGLEIIVGRRSLWVSVLVVVVIVAALGGVLWIFGTEAQRGEALGSTAVNQPLGEIKHAEIEINPAVGTLNIERLVDSTLLIQGEVDFPESSKALTNYSIQGEKGYYKIDSRPFNNFPTLGTWNWDLGLTERIPIQLIVAMGAGDLNLDLTGLILTSAEVSQGVGEITLILQESGNYDVKVSQAIGSIIITLPQDSGVRIQVDRAITNLDLPEGFTHEGDYYFSPGYDSKGNMINLEISQAIGNIEVRN